MKTPWLRSQGNLRAIEAARFAYSTCANHDSSYSFSGDHVGRAVTLPPYEYVAVIDESGDTGLRAVKPLDPNGSSEWMTISAVVYRRTLEAEADGWGRELMALTATRQTKEFSFTKLRDHRKQSVCEALAKKPVRIFVVVSNKKNMKGHKNPFAAAKNVSLIGKAPTVKHDWFYYWMSRVLLEKVTDWVYRHSVQEFGAPQKLRVHFSERGGIHYDELGYYYDLLRAHDIAGTQFIGYPIRWEVMDRRLLSASPHNAEPVLNLCDSTASAFFHACDKHDRNRPPFLEPALALWPRLAKKHRSRWPAGYGIKLMPAHYEVKIDPDQEVIFRRFGYSMRR